MFLFVCLQFCGCSTDNIGVFGTFGCKTLAIMLICIGDGIRDSLIRYFRVPLAIEQEVVKSRFRDSLGLLVFLNFFFLQ